MWSFLDQYHADRSDRFDSDYTEESARAALDSWVGEAFSAEAAVKRRVVNDLPARALLEASDAADLLVLGARGKGGFEGLLFGSVSERVAQLASRPVAVVRAAAAVRGARVVVGVDGSARSLSALRWAAAEARTRDAELDVVHAWQLPAMAAAPVMAAFPNYPMEEAGHAILDAAVAEPALADTRVHPHFVRDSPAGALITPRCGRRTGGGWYPRPWASGRRAAGIGEQTAAAPRTLPRSHHLKSGLSVASPEVLMPSPRPGCR